MLKTNAYSLNTNGNIIEVAAVTENGYNRVGMKLILAEEQLYADNTAAGWAELEKRIIETLSDLRDIAGFTRL